MDRVEEKLRNLDQDTAEQIILAYEGGQPPADRYLHLLMVGVEHIVNQLEQEIKNLRERKSNLSVVFLTSERGSGKTSLARALKERFQVVTQGYTVSVVLDLSLHRNVVEFTKNLYFKALLGTFNIPEVELEDQEQLIDKAVNFSVNLNAFLLNPTLLEELPLNHIRDLGKFIADVDGVLYIIIDELDRLSRLPPDAADNIFFMLKNLQDLTRLPKMYVFCATRESRDWIKSTQTRSNPFLSRIFTDSSKERNYLLSYSEDKLKKLIKRTWIVFEKAKRLNIPTSYQNLLEKIASFHSVPRHVIGMTVSLLNDYKVIKPLIDTNKANTGGFFSRSSIDIGKKIEDQLKPRILPYLNQLYSNMRFDPNPPSVPSTFQSGNRKADGHIIFPNGYEIMLEIKYSEHRAQLKRKNLDQIVSYLRDSNEVKKNIEGWFFLFGNYSSDNPINHEDTEWLQRIKVYNNIKIFNFPDKDILSELTQACEIATADKQKKAFLNWFLLMGDVHTYIQQISQEHEVEFKVQSGQKTLGNFFRSTESKQHALTPPSSNSDVPSKPSAPTSTFSSSKTRATEIPLSEIKGIGTTIAERLEKQLGITSVNELVRYNKHELAKVYRLSANRAQKFLDRARKLIND